MKAGGSHERERTEYSDWNGDTVENCVPTTVLNISTEDIGTGSWNCQSGQTL